MSSLNRELPDIFRQSAFFRAQDVYHPYMDWQTLVHDFYPDSLLELTQSQSSITASFYGQMLKQAGELFGLERMQELSSRTFYQHGKSLAQRHMARKPELERNARGITTLVLAAIFTSNPEYRFEILQFDAGHARIRMTGVDRYHRITHALGIDQHLQWPVNGDFFTGLRDELGLAELYAISQQLKYLDESSRCDYEIDIRAI
ncbi:hypothetical protein C4K38_4370 [Pseudomonas chlororaphis subsp. piscium]|uniref:hypothetical protein n=1 Tax=Pseudomonas chlororaphis TaxID=587753 RepID=UPI0006A57CE5|nr:hypothetical protein [Pseudomonas chlororaphis]AZC32321.1 hypothetical protein C4K38_4370 [Pseudomonas chlororaphis subsp. piscium]WDG90044.1 hypothetical protein PUP49_22520 [Pseudomonas chlororaphis]SDS67723.1 hypothetical protein SAMN05216585_3023 [Pseudomonas chlororaphis]